MSKNPQSTPSAPPDALPPAIHERRRDEVKHQLQLYSNSSEVSLLCTIILIVFMAIYAGRSGNLLSCICITCTGLPLLFLASLFSQSCRMAKRELKKMPDSILDARMQSLLPEELAVRLINNNAQLLSDHFCLLSEQERQELELDRYFYPTPENQPTTKRKSPFHP